MSNDEPIRDVDRTGFSVQLDRLLGRLPRALSVAFVDGEGETVDLASRGDPFDARIAGAEMAIVLASARRACAALGLGETLELRIECTRRSILARHVSAGYDLVVLLDEPSVSRRTAENTASVALELLVETGFAAPQAYRVPRGVEERRNQHGAPVPVSLELAGVRHRVEAILGYCPTEAGTEYLVRLSNGAEMLLRHEAQSGRWNAAGS